jgi:LuxR family transcriptional regulator, maltose regulon positive regulatory protein
MAHATPQVKGTLLLRPDHRGDLITVGTEAWFAWLEQASPFAFVGAGGRYTARKERAGRSGWYWKAYRMERGRLRRAYLGKSAELTLERLSAAADSLADQEAQADSSRVNREPASDNDTSASQSSTLGSRLLATKLAIPPARPGLVARPHLVERPYGCITAPASGTSSKDWSSKPSSIPSAPAIESAPRG